MPPVDHRAEAESPALRSVRHAACALDRARQQRLLAILEANAAGETTAAIARAAQLTPQRAGQIINSHRLPLQFP